MTAAVVGDNRVVQGLWVGGRLSALERLCIRSFCAMGHEFHLYHYDELQNVPRVDGLRVMDAAEILPRTAVFRNDKGSLAYFADHFRWELLRQRGGWWVDADMVCIRAFNFSAEVVFPRDFTSDYLWNSPLKFPRGHFLTAALADAYANVNRVQPWDNAKVRLKKFRRRLMFWRNHRRHIRHWQAGGMTGMMSAVRHFGLEKYALPVITFCLSEAPEGRKIVKSARYDFERLLSDAPELHCIHLSNSALSADGIDKDGEYPEDSLYEVLKRRYPEPGAGK